VKLLTGNSGTPLAKKLGIKVNQRIALVNAPPDMAEQLGPLPAGATLLPKLQQTLDLILLFAQNQKGLAANFAKLAARLASNGMLWVAWPKRSSRIATDLSFDVVQKIGLAAGLVDNKVCAISDVWSGLRFVIRIKDR
jgi:hypothetical protein